MDYEKVLGERKFPTYEELKTGLLQLIDEGKISREDASRLLPELHESEDERIRKWLVNYFSSIKETVWLHMDITCEQILDWLEKQKEPKPAEWSEEDEVMLDSAIKYVEHSAFSTIGKGKNNVLAWLKSLRPSWKPSEEQMNYLCAAVDVAIRKHNESVSGYKPARVLKSLYEDLQRL